MPPGQRVRLDDRKHGSPVGQPRKRQQGDARRIISPAGLDPTLLVKGQLLPEEQILGCQLRPRSKTE
jgi:hypothetical protein